MLKSILNLNGVNKLNREQQKEVKGGMSIEGFGGGSGNSENSGSCGYRVPNPGGFESVICGISRSQAISFAAAEGGYWCCNNCRSKGGVASYC